jgi:hypothetical protein
LAEAAPGQGESAANWVWLLPNGPVGLAVYVGRTGQPQSQGLRLHAADVLEFGPGEAQRVDDLAAESVSLALVDGDALPAAQSASLLAALRPAMQPGARLCLSFSAGPGLGGRWRGALAVSRARRALVAAGFTDVAHHYAVPDPDRPRAIVPATSTACALFEAIADGGSQARLRRLLARAGLHRFLYRGHFCLCTT